MTLTNGSTTISAWVAGIGGGYVGWLKQPDFNPQSGTYAVVLKSYRAAPFSYIEQAAPTAVGQTYEVAAYFSSEGNGGPAVVSVLANGVVIGSVTNGSDAGSLGPAYTNLVWTRAAFRFQASAATSTIRFQDATTGSDLSPIVDNVTVVVTLPPPPTLLAQPEGQTKLLGGSASFTASASGTPPVTFQWRLNGTALPGATNSVLTLSGLSASQAGNYTAVVSNSGGSTNSVNALLSLIELKTFAGRPSLSIFGPVAARYKIEVADAMSPPAWSTVTTFSLAGGPTLIIDPKSDPSSARFFRVTPLAP